MSSHRYQTVVSNDANAIVVDTMKDGVGGASGFKPAELLEAALAACTNLTLRITAEKLGLPLSGLTTTVRMNPAKPGTTEFAVDVVLEGDMSEGQRQQLLKSVRLCPVTKILNSPISVVYSGADAALAES
jgi:putative redox protein